LEYIDKFIYFKKGNKTDSINYRGVSHLLIIYIILPNSLLSMLPVCAEDIIGEIQCGFRRNRSTTDHLFSIYDLLEKE
jgi:hypothetical protein